MSVDRYCRGRWSPERKARFAAEVEAEIKLPHPGDVQFCQCCSNDLRGIVYSTHSEGVMRWHYVCEECAADWVAGGGTVAVRWVRQPLSKMEHA